MQHSFAKTRHNAPKLAKTRQKLFDAPTKEIETIFGDFRYDAEYVTAKSTWPVQFLFAHGSWPSPLYPHLGVARLLGRFRPAAERRAPGTGT